jgi:hypothetical protein
VSRVDTRDPGPFDAIVSRVCVGGRLIVVVPPTFYTLIIIAVPPTSESRVALNFDFRFGGILIIPALDTVKRDALRHCRFAF